MPKVLWKPGTMIYPLPPVMVSCGTLESPNIITVAWTGIINSDPAMTYISLKPQRFSHGIVEKQQEFVINLTSEDLIRAADLCGVKSGRDIDKFAATKLTPIKCEHVGAPMIQESPVSLECRVVENSGRLHRFRFNERTRSVSVGKKRRCGVLSRSLLRFGSQVGQIRIFR